jgi:hypothetical protein
MTRKRKTKTGRVITVSKEDNLLLKKIFIIFEEVGTNMTNSEICDQLFSNGIHNYLKEKQ